MIDITLQNFEAELIQASLTKPVLLDIWAPWCGPCRQLGPILEKLETEYAGRFVLAKLNADEVPEISTQLSQMFGVRSIPFCVMFAQGQPVDGFVGAIPEEQIREFLGKHVPEGEAQPEEPAVEEEAAPAGADDVLGRLAQAVEARPDDETARYDYVKALLEQGQLKEAQAAFAPVAAIAASTLTPHARFAALAAWIAAAERAAAGIDAAALRATIETNKRDFEARFALAQAAFAKGDFTAAMDELLEILMRDKAWNSDAARKTYVAILELMSKPAPKAAADAGAGKSTLEIAGKAVVPQADPVLDQYRRKLSMALF